MTRRLSKPDFFSHGCPKCDCSFVVRLKLIKTDNGWSRRRGISE
jgi:hypothetical protein